MLSTDKIPEKLPNQHQTSLAARKRPATTIVQSDQVLRCPRCDSPNTKFCYYNNYSLTQPRHFCKTCRRYWTKGGVLRNVPVGGGCRKSKKTKSAAAASNTTSSNSGCLRFLNGLSSAMEFQINGLPFTRLHSPTAGAFTQLYSLGGPSSTAATSPCSAFEDVPCSSSLEGFNHYTSSTALRMGESGVFRGLTQENIASSIDCLSSINQELHWKLQHQRLAMLSAASAPLIENQQQQQQAVSIPPAQSSKTEACVDRDINVLLLENSYSVVDGNTNINMSNWNEMQTWSDSHQYSGLP